MSPCRIRWHLWKCNLYCFCNLLMENKERWHNSCWTSCKKLKNLSGKIHHIFDNSRLAFEKLLKFLHFINQSFSFRKGTNYHNVINVIIISIPIVNLHYRNNLRIFSLGCGLLGYVLIGFTRFCEKSVSDFELNIKLI